MEYDAFAGNRNIISVFDSRSLDAQRRQVDWEKQQKLNEFRTVMTEVSEISYANRVVALKLLIHEAHRLEVARTKASKALSPVHNTKKPQKLHWNRLAVAALDDAEIEGTPNVQKNLSCMCIFANTDKASLRYGENSAERMTRVIAQQRVLRQLAEQAERGGSHLFLAPSQK